MEGKNYNLGLLFIGIFLFVYSYSYSQNLLGTRVHTPEAHDGYTLITPSMSHKSFLINNCGEVINEWESPNISETATYLTPEGHLIKTCISEKPTGLQFYGKGGLIEMWSWDNELLWYYDFNSLTETTNHDIAIMPNGHLLVLFSRLINEDIAKELGKTSNGPIYATVVKEIKMIGTDQMEVIWEWDVADHFIQDRHSDKPNYGIIQDHPQRLNINYIPLDPHGNPNTSNQADMFHANGIDYNPELDQIMITLRNFSEIWIIDHSTTTAEAKKSSGGAYGKGGDLLFRYGNPRTYNAGTVADQILRNPHAGEWIQSNKRLGGNIMIFNNGYSRSLSTEMEREGYSEVLVITNPYDSYTSESDYTNGSHSMILMEYGGQPGSPFKSKVMSNANVLSNGNILINVSNGSLIQEITSTRELVWEYRIPTNHDEEVGHEGPIARNGAFKVTKYDVDLPMFSNKNMNPKRHLGLFEIDHSKCQNDYIIKQEFAAPLSANR